MGVITKVEKNVGWTFDREFCYFKGACKCQNLITSFIIPLGVLYLLVIMLHQYKISVEHHWCWMNRIKFKVLKTYLESLFLSQNLIRGYLFQFQLRNGLTAWKASQYGVISGPYFPVFGMNTEIYGVNLHIQSYGPEIKPYLDIIHAVNISINIVKCKI